MFAVPVLKPTYGILDWIIQKIRNIDIKTTTTKISMTDNFDINSDVECFYIPRSKGGKGLKAIPTAYECGTVSLNHHLTKKKTEISYRQLCVYPRRMKMGEWQVNYAVNMIEKLRIWSHLLKKFLMENFIFCAVVIAKFVYNPLILKKNCTTPKT